MTIYLILLTLVTLCAIILSVRNFLGLRALTRGFTKQSVELNGFFSSMVRAIDDTKN